MTTRDSRFEAAAAGRSSNAAGVRIAATRFGLAYAIAVFLFAAIVWTIAGGGTRIPAWGKALHYASCAVMAAGLSVLLFRLHERFVQSRTSEDSLPFLVGASFLLSMLAAPAWAAIGYLLSVMVFGSPSGPLDLQGFGYDIAIGGGFLFGWSSLFITLVFAFELNDRKVRLAAIREEALEAQMRALRYQVNPHFLFNTLNSIAGLIEEGQATQAERMVLSLSTFLRTTLALDPFHDVTLADEIALQREYLEIERERFSDRMRFVVTIEPGAEASLVPSLILQPLVENAIKHGVGQAQGRVNVVLSARRDGNSLVVAIDNDIPAAANTRPRPAGTGVGLKNVEERLRVRFQEDGRLNAGPVAHNMFRASLELPWRVG